MVAKANLGHGGSFDETRRAPRGSLRSRHHWSNVSSLSTDSGIVGLNDAREELDAGGEAARTKPAEVERADSGIGQTSARKWRSRAAETLSSLQAWEAHRPCTDCGERDLPAETDVQNCNQRRADLCEKCRKRRTERKESVLEFVNTEASYGEDLRIIKEEFYLPMQAAGLLSQEQLLGIFSNIQELIDLNENFLEILQEEIDQAFDQVRCLRALQADRSRFCIRKAAQLEEGNWEVEDSWVLLTCPVSRSLSCWKPGISVGLCQVGAAGLNPLALPTVVTPLT